MFGKKDNSEQSQPDFEYFAIYDSKSGMYYNPVPAANKLVALRDLETLYTDPKEQRNTIVTNAEDFSIFKVGYYFKKTGQIVGIQPEHVANLHEIKSLALRNARSQERPVTDNSKTLEEALGH